MNESIVFNVTGGPTWQKQVITTDILRALCKSMDDQAYHTAIAGFILSLVAIIYFGRIREYFLKKQQEKVVHFSDKFLLTLIALCFAIIIVRMLRGQ